MKKGILVLILALCSLFSFGQLDITKRKVSLDSINARTNNVYINDPVFIQDTNLVDLIKFHGGPGETVNFGTDGQIPRMNVAGSDFVYSSGFTWDGNTLSLETDSGINNVFIGKTAGNSITTGNDNTLVGFESGKNNLVGIRNTYLGSNTGHTTNADFNTFIGYNSGYTNITGDGNTFVGYASGYTTTGSNNIFIGKQAGQEETSSNKLYIENSSSATPLIYGDFANDSVVINGDLRVTGAIKGSARGALFGRYSSLNTATADVWAKVKLDTVIAAKTTEGFKFNDDSTGIVVLFDGFLSFSGHAKLKFNGSPAVDASVFVRLKVNSVEQSEFNTATTQNFKPNGSTDLVSFTAPVFVNTNDTIYIEAQVTNTDIDLESIDGGIFDEPVAFAIYLQEIPLKK